MKKALKIIFMFVVFLNMNTFVQAMEPYRIATTSATFLEIGYGSDALAMGGAYVSNTRGLSSIYWNPAGLGYMEDNEFNVSYQPWLVDMKTTMASVAYANPRFGTFALGLIAMDYGKEEVTTVAMPDGTGENFSGSDMSVTFSYGKKLAQWFSFGVSSKYISSNIWHEKASAVALDIGAVVNTGFFSWTGEPGDGLSIGTSISNYGTRLSYNGIDLKQSVDILPNEDGNYKYVPARFEVEKWELPLIFRLGVSFHPYMTEYQDFTISIDALHPNNNSESVNIGGEYEVSLSSYGSVALRAGYNGLFMEESVYGLTFGFGLDMNFFGNKKIIMDYAFREHKYFANINSFSIGVEF